MGWKFSNPSPDEKQCRDLVKLNKLATIDGCTNAAAVRTFHKEHEVLKKSHETQRKGANTLPKKFVGTTFGEPSRPSTPVKTLIKQIVTAEAEKDYPTMERKRHSTPAIRTTRAARGQDVRYVGVSDSIRENKVKEPFKLKKFAKIPARVSSNNVKSPTAASGKEISLSEMADQLEREIAAGQNES
jgi:hypothetical protein